VTMRSHQTGITFIGWLFLLIPIAMVAYAGIRIAPMYLNYMKVAKALEQTAGESVGESQLNVDAVRRSLARRFDIDAVTFPDVKSIAVTRDSGKWTLVADYEDVAPLFGGVSLLIHFEKRAVVE
jgi:Domain of unknown function (DUF4845)